MKRIFGLLLFTLAIFALSLHAAAAIKDTRPVVKIGMMAPVTGAIANVGENIVAWRGLAEKELSARSTHYQYQILVEDDMFQPQQSLQAAKRLVNLNNVNILCSYGSTSGVAVATFADSAKVPHIALGYDPRIVAGNYTVNFSPTAVAHFPAFLKLLEKKNYHRIAVFGVRSSTWQPILAELHKLDTKGTLKIAYEKIYSPGERDFRLGFQMMPNDIDAVLFLAWSPEVNILGRQYHEQKMTKPIIGLGGSLSFSTEPENFTGCVDVLYGDMTKANEINLKLTGKPIGNQGGAVAYSEIMRIVEVCESLYTPGKVPSSKAILAQILATKDYPAILGNTSCGADKFFQYPIHYYKIEKNGFRVVSIDEL